MSTETQENTTPAAHEESLKTPRRVDWRLGIILVLSASSIPIWHAVTSKGVPSTAPSGSLPVAAVKVAHENLTKELVVQAEFHPFQEIEVHPKVAGFLKKLNVDVGDQVKEGQLLAVIEVPELEDDLTRAEAVIKRSEQEVVRAEATEEEARVANERLTAAANSQRNLIAQQELDAARAKERVAASTLAAAKEQVSVSRAEVKKFRTMLEYSRLIAPFSGVITKRYVDPGEIIQAGTGSRPLVRLSQANRLRLVFPVSMSYVTRVKVGDSVDVRVPSLDKTFRAKISRSTSKIETATRTMDVEADVENPDLSLIPGMYASVVLTLERREHALAAPIQAVARGASSSVLVINSGQELEERKVKLGLETPAKVEILDGLKDGDLVVIGSRAQFKAGQKVEPKLVQPEKE